MTILFFSSFHFHQIFDSHSLASYPYFLIHHSLTVHVPLSYPVSSIPNCSSNFPPSPVSSALCLWIAVLLPFTFKKSVHLSLLLIMMKTNSHSLPYLVQETNILSSSDCSFCVHLLLTTSGANTPSHFCFSAFTLARGFETETKKQLPLEHCKAHSFFTYFNWSVRILSDALSQFCHLQENSFQVSFSDRYFYNLGFLQPPSHKQLNHCIQMYNFYSCSNLLRTLLRFLNTFPHRPAGKLSKIICPLLGLYSLYWFWDVKTSFS